MLLPLILYKRELNRIVLKKRRANEIYRRILGEK